MALDADIAAAATTLDVQKLQAQDYRNALKASAAQRAVDDERYAAALQKQEAERQALAAWRTSNLALTQRSVAVAEREAAKLATPDQERFMELLRMNMAIRLGPSVITTATSLAVIHDIAKDAVSMTEAQWPLVKEQLDKLAGPVPAPPPSGPTIPPATNGGSD